MTNHDDQPTHVQTPTTIRDKTFSRKMLGLDLDQVYEYLDLLADQLQAAERASREAQSEDEHLRAENERLRAENERLQSESERLRGELERAQKELAEHENAEDRVNDQVVQMFSQAQLVAEQMVEDVSRDARDRVGQARAHERRIVEEAMDAAGAQVRSYAREAQSQMQAIMRSFASEVDRVGGPSPLDMSRRWEVDPPRRSDDP